MPDQPEEVVLEPDELWSFVCHKGNVLDEAAPERGLSASEQNPEARLLWLADILKLEATCLVFVDESGFQLNMTPGYAYAPKGERAYGSVPKNRGENTSLLVLQHANGYLSVLLAFGYCFDNPFSQVE